VAVGPSCEHFLCVYVANRIVECIHRLDVQGAFTQWPVNDVPEGISVNAAHNVLVTCGKVRKIKEFGTHGDLPSFPFVQGNEVGIVE